MGSINIVHLVSGEQVITKLTELRDQDGEPFCFLLQMPMTLTLVPGETENETQINYFPWSPFSGTKEFRIGFEKIVSIAEPLPHVYTSYVEINQPVFPLLTPEEFEQFKKSKGAIKP
jgi:hypothetical protein|tara:strand:- start:814 stop:1164 length:351 start_codon:yes stop_codon:yes gene_type:complete